MIWATTVLPLQDVFFWGGWGGGWPPFWWLMPSEEACIVQSWSNCNTPENMPEAVRQWAYWNIHQSWLCDNCMCRRKKLEQEKQRRCAMVAGTTCNKTKEEPDKEEDLFLATFCCCFGCFVHAERDNHPEGVRKCLCDLGFTVEFKIDYVLG